MLTVSDLPVEVLSDIFLACIPRDTKTTLSSAEAPLLLCSVCSVWRTIVIKLPYLWSRLCVRLTRLRSDPRDPSLVLRLIDLFLSRSGQQPLVFSVMSSHTQNLDTDSVINVILSLSKRIHTLYIDVPASVKLDNLLDSPANDPHSFDNLEILDLKISLLPLSLRRFRDISTLRRVKVDIWWRLEPIFHFPWQHLTHLDFTSVALQRGYFLKVLTQCEALIYGSFSIDGNDGLSFQHEAVLSRLTHLRLHFIASQMHSLGRGFQFPAMKYLELSGSFQSSLGPSGRLKLNITLQDMIPFGEIHSLVLTHAPWHTSPEVLISLPALVSLTLNDSFVTGITPYFHILSSTPNLLPQLSNLVVYIHAKIATNKLLENYALMIKDRCVRKPDRRRLTMASLFVVDGTSDHCDAVRNILEPCVVEGLELIVQPINQVPEVLSWNDMNLRVSC